MLVEYSTGQLDITLANKTLLLLLFLLGWPEIYQVFLYIFWKNLNELFGQYNIIIIIKYTYHKIYHFIHYRIGITQSIYKTVKLPVSEIFCHSQWNPCN